MSYLALKLWAPQVCINCGRHRFGLWAWHIRVKNWRCAQGYEIYAAYKATESKSEPHFSIFDSFRDIRSYLRFL